MPGTKRTPPLTPHEKLHEDLANDVQKKADVLLQDSNDKAATLLAATNMLVAQVAALTTVVETNNEHIRGLRREVDQKPDDSEVQFIAGLAHDERQRHLRLALVMSVLCAVTAASVSFGTVNHLSKQRCHSNAHQTETLVRLLSHFDLDKKNTTIQSAISQLNSDKVVC